MTSDAMWHFLSNVGAAVGRDIEYVRALAPEGGREFFERRGFFETAHRLLQRLRLVE